MLSGYLNSRFKDKRGAVLIYTFIVLVGLTAIISAFIFMISHEIRSAGAGLDNMKAFYIAEAGLAKARWALTTGEEDVGWGESDISFGNGTYTVTTTDNGDDTYTIQSEGYIPDDTNPIAKRLVMESNIPLTGELTNLSLGAAITASSSKLPQNPPTNANDGDYGTTWKAGSKNDAWLKLDFGSSTTFDRVIYSGKNINSVAIEYSNNDSSYTGVTNAVESPAGTVNFDPVSARYLRFNMDVDSNRTAELDELESYDTSGGGSTTLGRGKFFTSW